MDYLDIFLNLQSITGFLATPDDLDEHFASEPLPLPPHPGLWLGLQQALGTVDSMTLCLHSGLHALCPLFSVFLQYIEACLIHILQIIPEENLQTKPLSEGPSDEWSHLASPETIEPIESGQSHALPRRTQN